MTQVRVLGTTQDGGLPHPNCICKNCTGARQDLRVRRRVASISIEDENQVIMIDATPDFTEQTGILKQLYPGKVLGCDAIFLTHLHIGHYLGLAMLGREAAGTTEFPVYTSSQNHEMLEHNKPFSYLYERGQIQKMVILPNTATEFPGFTVTGVEVPHRNEDGNTLGYRIDTGEISFLYIPDIDFLSPAILSLIRKTDIVLFDATFYDQNEIARQKSVPHPLVVMTMREVGRREPGSFYFTHLNHSNPLLHDTGLLGGIQKKGYSLAEEGMIISLDE